MKRYLYNDLGWRDPILCVSHPMTLGCNDDNNNNNNNNNKNKQSKVLRQIKAVSGLNVSRQRMQQRYICIFSLIRAGPITQGINQRSEESERNGENYDGNLSLTWEKLAVTALRNLQITTSPYLEGQRWTM
uniref:Uncharacterized protein n=1 Tax=Glossina pallidipes TaxID=7398 RepID=A0A1A9ZHX7_GLOPL